MTASSSTTTTSTQQLVSLSLVGRSKSDPSAEEQYKYASADTGEVDPERFWAANVEDWDYSNGNPPNAVWQGQNIAIRPNNGSVVLLIAQGINIIGVRDASRYDKGQIPNRTLASST